PWILEMSDLIAECPNIVPTGVGNSATVGEINLTVLQKDIKTDGSTEPANPVSDGFETHDGDTMSDGPSILNDDISQEIDKTSNIEEDVMDVDEVEKLVHHVFLLYG